MNYQCFLIFVMILQLSYSAPEFSRRRCVDYIASKSNAEQIQETNVIADNSESEYGYDDEVSQAINNHTDEPRTIKCSMSSNFCYAVWTIDINRTMTIVRQGCWDSADKHELCIKQECISDETTIASKISHKFCCCSGDLCNTNVTMAEIIETVETEIDSNAKTTPLLQKSILASPAVWICFIIIAIIITSMAIFVVCHGQVKAESELSPLSPSGPGYSSNLHNVDNLKLCAMIGQGKYGTVWKGMINEQSVAVKIFPAQHKQYFLNECIIYSLPLMDSPALLQYFGCDERHTLDNNVEYLLVLSLAPYGCLQDWLIDNTTTFNIFCNMAKSIASGLSHLHTEFRNGDLIKPCISHRDLNSRNILVKEDLTCCISDFGFALKTFGPRYEYKGELTLAETKSINEVGTLRYMAPEILEGAVNLRDCESALKQIDVYSLGLVLWELCTKCSDFYPPEQPVPTYKSPYELEIGKNPSFEQMQVLVCRHKARPLFPPIWGGGPASKIAKDTCEDCWDPDAEARLTSLCVEERIIELSALHPRSYHSRTPSPSLNRSNLASPTTVKNSGFLNLITTPPNQIIPNINGTTVSFNDDIIIPQEKQQLHGQNTNVTVEKSIAQININQQILIDNIEKQDKMNKDNTNMNRNNEQIGITEIVLPSKTSLDKKLKGWHGVRQLIDKKMLKNFIINNDDKLNLVESKLLRKSDDGQHNIEIIRPKNLNLLSTTNNNNNNNNTQIILNNNTNHNNNSNVLINLENEKIFQNRLNHIFKKLPGDNTNQKFTIMNSSSPRIVVSKSANAVKNLSTSELLDERQIKRQRSLEIFHEVFSSRGSNERLRDPSQRVKTPGDVPPSVRKIRASKTLSLYDDRMMDSNMGNTL